MRYWQVRIKLMRKAGRVVPPESLLKYMVYIKGTEGRAS